MLNFNIGVFITNRVRDRREKTTAQRGLVAIARPSLRGHDANQVTPRKLFVADGFDRRNFSNKVRRNQQY
jgi:hypothetical protein